MINSVHFCQVRLPDEHSSNGGLACRRQLLVSLLGTLGLLALNFGGSVWAQPAPIRSGLAGFTAQPTEAIALPDGTPDPLEPVNRFFWGVNKIATIDVIQPTGVAYRSVVCKPIRDSIAGIGRTLTFPGRVVNHLLQGRWEGARAETDRFFYNTVIGLGGTFDVATQVGIPKSEADFGQTYGKWGWEPKAFLMIPLGGPSNDRDAVGLVCDSLATPSLYFTPYSYSSYGIAYNGLSEKADAAARFIECNLDPYSNIAYEWTFARSRQKPDFHVKSDQDPSSLETLGVAFVTFKEPEFPNHARTRTVRIPATGRELKFTYWLQPKPSPVVYILPGLGAHRLFDQPLALAELLFQHGYSAVCLSSPYNFEFMESASTAAMPAYTPVDGHDLHVALTEIDHRLEKLHPGKLGARATLGYSMGAFLSLYIASTQATNQEALVKFERTVALNTPVRLLHGVSKLDEFYRAPLALPPAERTPDMRNAILKVSALAQAGPPDPESKQSFPFSAVESKFLIGLQFRMILRDIIYSSQSRHNQAILTNEFSSMKRKELYKEIMQYSYQDYFTKFVVPYYQSRGLDLTISDTLNRASNLRTYEDGFKANHNIRLILNENDFLLAPEDLQWLRDSASPDHVSLFEHGGHLGNLGHPKTREAILHALEGLK